MTADSQGRAAHRMSRFSQAYRGMSANGAGHSPLDEHVERTLHRAEIVNAAIATPHMQSAPVAPDSQIIEVEFETVPPLPRAPDPAAFRRAEPNTDPVQPPPPDIEAIAAALAEEMDRNLARTAKPVAQEAPQAPVQEPEPSPPAQPAAVQSEASPAPEAAPVQAEASVPAESAPAEPDAGLQAQAILADADTGPSLVETVNSQLAAAAQAEIPSLRGESAASQGARIAALAREQMVLLGRQTAKFARDKAGPALYSAGLWLAHNLRRKEIRRRYGTALALVHGRLLDRRLEKDFYISTLAVERFAPDLERGILYEGPVPAKAFEWALSQLPADLREFAFVDFRAGRGRALLLASQRNFEEIIGYEYDAARFDDLQMNIAQFPRYKMMCRNVQAFRGDRIGVSIPNQPCVLYVANAWREDLAAGIMDYVRETYRHRPRRLYLILENVDEQVSLPPDDVFHRVELPLAEKLKLRLFSPMDFQIYRSAV